MDNIIIYQEKGLYAAVLASTLINGIDYTPLPNTTVNEGLGITIASDNAISPYKARYLMLGRGGVYRNPDLTMPFPVKHDPREVCPRDPIPLYATLIENDASTPPYYKLRKEEERNGRIYAVYYAIVLEDPPSISQMTVRDGDYGGTVAYSADPKFNKPRDTILPPNLTIDSMDLVVAEYIVTGTPIHISIVGDIENNIRSAAATLHDNVEMALFSEAFICFGREYEIGDRIEIGNVAPIIMLAFNSLSSMQVSIDLGISEPVVTYSSPGDIYDAIDPG